MKHEDIWGAIDKLAHSKGLSSSGLAKMANLDPTAFNKSKRKSPTGRMRWPSTESISKILQATNTSLDDFFALISAKNPTGVIRTIPLLGFAQAGNDGYFDDAGFPAGSEGWDGIEFPKAIDENTYALEVSGSSMEPAYRDGDRLIVSPQSHVRKGDRVVVKTKEGEVMVKELKRQSAIKIELKSLNPEHPDRNFDLSDIEWMARVIWVSQ